MADVEQPVVVNGDGDKPVVNGEQEEEIKDLKKEETKVESEDSKEQNGDDEGKDKADESAGDAKPEDKKEEPTASCSAEGGIKEKVEEKIEQVKSVVAEAGQNVEACKAAKVEDIKVDEINALKKDLVGDKEEGASSATGDIKDKVEQVKCAAAEAGENIEAVKGGKLEEIKLDEAKELKKELIDEKDTGGIKSPGFIDRVKGLFSCVSKSGGATDVDVKPKNLKEFGYIFKDGKMVDTEKGEPFVFDVNDGDHKLNQERYEAIAKLVEEHVYGLLEKEGKLKKIQIPKDAKKNEAKGFIFASKDYAKKDKLMIIIHGSGAVRAGQWSRKLIMSDSINTGTQLPYIKKAHEEGYGVVVLNTNQNKVKVKGEIEEQLIKGSETPENHCLYVWDNFISTAVANRIVIVAHSYGGVVVTDLAIQRDEFVKKVSAVAFTDSVHSPLHQQMKPALGTYFQENTKNWVSSDEELDKELLSNPNDCVRVSAGHEMHEMTSSAAFESIFKFFTEKLEEAKQKEEKEKEEAAKKDSEEKEMETDEKKTEEKEKENGEEEKTEKMETEETPAE